MPDAQTIWNGVLTVALAIMSGALILLRDVLKGMQREIKEQTFKVQAIELLVAGEYVRKDDFDRRFIRLFEKLDAMDAKLDTKVNRGDCPVIHSAYSKGDLL